MTYCSTNKLDYDYKYNRWKEVYIFYNEELEIGSKCKNTNSDIST